MRTITEHDHVSTEFPPASDRRMRRLIDAVKIAESLPAYPTAEQLASLFRADEPHDEIETYAFKGHLITTAFRTGPFKAIHTAVITFPDGHRERIGVHYAGCASARLDAEATVERSTSQLQPEGL